MIRGDVPRRVVPLQHPVTLYFEGEPTRAEQGEPVAAALVASGRLALARSSKFHRPRGPACLRGACDGCLARVDGVPNVMTCRVPASEGMHVEVQNVLGSENIDLLRVTDWFFPEGMDHHELFAGVPGVQQVMQAFARRVAGLGKLPSELERPRRAARREADVLIVGAGPAGMAMAARLAARGRKVEILDDALEIGGALRALAREDLPAWGGIDGPFKAAAGAGVLARRATTVGGIFGDDVLAVGPQGAEVITARAVVLATGAHDGVLAFEGNDVPGVMSARAGGFLLRCGVLVGDRVVVVAQDGARTGGQFGESFARAAAASGCEVTLVRGELVRVRGSRAVRGAIVREGSRERKLNADAVLVDAARAPAYELCQQAGAELVHEPRGFVVRASLGKIRDGFYAVGEVAGVPLEPAALEQAADEVARQV